MALEKQELANEGLGERIHSMSGRFGKNIVSREFQVFGRKIIVPGVGNEAVRFPHSDERMAALACEGKHTYQLITQATALDSIQMKDGGVCGQTRKNRGKRILLRPVDDLCE